MKQYQINEHAYACEIKPPHGSTEIGVYIDQNDSRRWKILVGVITHPVGSTWWFWHPNNQEKKSRFRSKRGALEKADIVSKTFNAFKINEKKRKAIVYYEKNTEKISLIRKETRKLNKLQKLSKLNELRYDFGN